MKTLPLTFIALALSWTCASASAQDKPAGGVAPFTPFNGAPQALPPGGAMPPGPRPPDHVAIGPSLEAALVMAKEAVAACAGQQVGVSILDSEGNPKLYYVPDGTAGSHAYTGFRKANTALRYKEPTSKVHERAQTDATFDAEVRADPNLVSWAGGAPIEVNGVIIGAIGVSGAEPSEKDEACALVGIAKARRLLR
jgi:uncharacterized protein GlcG (DUF336 family)